MIIQGLEGVKDPIEVTEWAHNKTQALRQLREKNVASTATDHYSLTIWKKDEGGYIGEKHNYGRTVARIETNNQKELVNWFGTQLT